MSMSRRMLSSEQQEKEQLYEDALALKQNIHAARAENSLLKSKVQQNAQASVKKDRIIKDLLERIRNPNIVAAKFVPKTHLLAALKAKARETKQENLALRRELRALQKDPRLTALSELESECRVYSEEFARLSGMVEQVENRGDLVPPEDAAVVAERLKLQEDDLARARQEGADLQERIKRVGQEIAKLQAEAKTEKREEDKTSAAVAEEAGKVVREQKKEIQRLRERADEMRSAEEGKKDESEELRRAKEEREAQVAKKDEKIQSLEQKIQDILEAKEEEAQKLRDSLGQSMYEGKIFGSEGKEGGGGAHVLGEK